MSSWKDDAEINRSQLDAECARMPVVYQRWSNFEQLACAAEDHAAHQLVLAEDAMKKAAARAHIQLRGWSTVKINRELGTELDPTKPSLSEQIYKDLTLMHPLVKEAETQLNDARVAFMVAKAHRREMQSARYTMDIKDKSLKKLVDIGDRMFGMSGSYQPRRSSTAGARATTVSENVTATIREHLKGKAAAPGSLAPAAGRIRS